MWKRGKKVGNFKVYDRVGGILEIQFIGDQQEGRGTYKVADRLMIEATWKNGKLNGKLLAKFTQVKSELEIFYKDGVQDGKERIVKGEVTEQMKNFVKKLDFN